jgi:ABC-type transport system substrate-binding protein
VLVVSACGGSAGGSSNPDRALRIASPADVSSLDPIRGNAGSDHVMLYPLYDTLVSFNEGMEAQPGLAESWEQPTPTELVLRLREGVTFHDGTPFDAEAVKFNLERAAGEGSNIAPDIASVKSVEVVDPLTVKLTLSRPDASLLMVLADRAGMMVSPTAAKAAGGDLSTQPVGAGAWSFVSWKRGDALTYERFDDYWNTEVDRVAEMRINIIPDPKTRATSLRSGQQDIALELAPADAASLEKADGVTLHEDPRMYLQQVYLNRSDPALKDPRVRRALSVAIDREAILKSAFFERGVIAHGALPEDFWAAPPESVVYPYDPQEAESLLQEAGAQGLSFDMIANGDAATVRVAEILKQQWSEIGVTVNIRPLEVVQATNEYFNERKAPALLSAWTGRPDPSMTYRLMFTEEAYFNTSDQGTPGIDQALVKADQSLEQEARKTGLDEAAAAVYEDTPILPLVFPSNLIAVGEGIEGFQGNLLGKPKFTGVTIG